MDSSPISIGLILLAFVLLYIQLRRRNSSKTRIPYNEAPQPGGAWPVIGHVPILGSHPNIGRVLAAVAKEQGPLFMLRLGTHRTLVVNTCELAGECLTTKDRALATRPVTAAGELMGYNNAMVGFAPYGDYWRQLRKISALELLSHARLEELKHVRTSEVDTFVKDIYSRWAWNNRRQPVEVEMKQWFRDLTFNVVVRMVAGKRFFGNGSSSSTDEARRFTKAMSELFILMGTFVASDLLPFLRCLDLGGYKRAMKCTAAEMDCLLNSWLEDHRKRREEAAGKASKKADFMDVLLSAVEKAHLSGHETDTIIKANCLAMLIGGTDTTSVSLTWVLSLLLNHPRALEKAQQELDTQVGRDRHVEESDIKNLVYLQAIIKEALRLYPPAPVLVPHEAMVDCTVGGFDVQAGTRVLVNVWAIQRDANAWTEPSEFKPERFLLESCTADIDVRGHHFKLLPFGSGRRACPGISFALQVMHLALASLIHGFHMATPSGDPVDMTEGFGVTLPKATPLNVLFTPRLPSELYE